nr:MAG TPA: hypothetical protein [Caudoviricetes sp.]
MVSLYSKLLRCYRSPYSLFYSPYSRLTHTYLSKWLSR